MRCARDSDWCDGEACREFTDCPNAEPIDVQRVDRRASCPVCGEPYGNHPWDKVNVSGIDGTYYLHIGCASPLQRLKT